MPKVVSQALVLLFATLAIGLVRSYFEFENASIKAAALGGGSFVIGVQAFTFAIMVALFALIAWRKNWARWTFVTLFVLGTPLSVKPLIDSLESEPVSGALGLIQMAMQIAAVWLLFRPEARAWFAKPSTVNPQA